MRFAKNNFSCNSIIVAKRLDNRLIVTHLELLSIFIEKSTLKTWESEVSLRGRKYEGASAGDEIRSDSVQSTLGFATMGKAANLYLATRNAVTDLF